MTEEAARKKLVAICKEVISDWDSGRDWRWPSAGHETAAKLEQLKPEMKWRDYRSLAAVWWFLFRISQAITDGMSSFDHLSWEETLAAIEESARRLEKELPVEDPIVLHYLPSITAHGCNPFAAVLMLFRSV